MEIFVWQRRPLGNCKLPQLLTIATLVRRVEVSITPYGSKAGPARVVLPSRYGRRSASWNNPQGASCAFGNDFDGAQQTNIPFRTSAQLCPHKSRYERGSFVHTFHIGHSVESERCRTIRQARKRCGFGQHHHLSFMRNIALQIALVDHVCDKALRFFDRHVHAGHLER